MSLIFLLFLHFQHLLEELLGQSLLVLVNCHLVHWERKIITDKMIEMCWVCWQSTVIITAAEMIGKILAELWGRISFFTAWLRNFISYLLVYGHFWSCQIVHFLVKILRLAQRLWRSSLTCHWFQIPWRNFKFELALHSFVLLFDLRFVFWVPSFLIRSVILGTDKFFIKIVI